MLSLIVHFPLCLCKGKSNISLSLVGYLWLLSMIVGTVSDSLSDITDRRTSVLKQQLENIEPKNFLLDSYSPGSEYKSNSIKEVEAAINKVSLLSIGSQFFPAVRMTAHSRIKVTSSSTKRTFIISELSAMHDYKEESFLANSGIQPSFLNWYVSSHAMTNYITSEKIMEGSTGLDFKTSTTISAYTMAYLVNLDPEMEKSTCSTITNNNDFNLKQSSIYTGSLVSMTFSFSDVSREGLSTSLHNHISDIKGMSPSISEKEQLNSEINHTKTFDYYHQPLTYQRYYSSVKELRKNESINALDLETYITKQSVSASSRLQDFSTYLFSTTNEWKTDDVSSSSSFSSSSSSIPTDSSFNSRKEISETHHLTPLLQELPRLQRSLTDKMETPSQKNYIKSRKNYFTYTEDPHISYFYTDHMKSIPREDSSVVLIEFNKTDIIATKTISLSTEALSLDKSSPILFSMDDILSKRIISNLSRDSTDLFHSENSRQFSKISSEGSVFPNDISSSFSQGTVTSYQHDVLQFSQKAFFSSASSMTLKHIDTPLKNLPHTISTVNTKHDSQFMETISPYATNKYIPIGPNFMFSTLKSAEANIKILSNEPRYVMTSFVTETSAQVGKTDTAKETVLSSQFLFIKSPRVSDSKQLSSELKMPYQETTSFLAGKISSLNGQKSSEQKQFTITSKIVTSLLPLTNDPAAIIQDKHITSFTKPSINDIKALPSKQINVGIINNTNSENDVKISKVYKPNISPTRTKSLSAIFESDINDSHFAIGKPNVSNKEGLDSFSGDISTNTVVELASVIEQQRSGDQHIDSLSINSDSITPLITSLYASEISEQGIFKLSTVLFETGAKRLLPISNEKIILKQNILEKSLKSSESLFSKTLPPSTVLKTLEIKSTHKLFEPYFHKTHLPFSDMDIFGHYDSRSSDDSFLTSKSDTSSKFTELNSSEQDISRSIIFRNSKATIELNSLFHDIYKSSFEQADIKRYITYSKASISSVNSFSASFIGVDISEPDTSLPLIYQKNLDVNYLSPSFNDMKTTSQDYTVSLETVWTYVKEISEIFSEFRYSSHRNATLQTSLQESTTNKDSKSLQKFATMEKKVYEASTAEQTLIRFKESSTSFMKINISEQVTPVISENIKNSSTTGIDDISPFSVLNGIPQSLDKTNIQSSPWIPRYNSYTSITNNIPLTIVKEALLSSQIDAYTSSLLVYNVPSSSLNHGFSSLSEINPSLRSLRNIEINLSSDVNEITSSSKINDGLNFSFTIEIQSSSVKNSNQFTLVKDSFMPLSGIDKTSFINKLLNTVINEILSSSVVDGILSASNIGEISPSLSMKVSPPSFDINDIPSSPVIDMIPQNSSIKENIKVITNSFFLHENLSISNTNKFLSPSFSNDIQSTFKPSSPSAILKVTELSFIKEVASSSPLYGSFNSFDIDVISLPFDITEMSFSSRIEAFPTVTELSNISVPSTSLFSDATSSSVIEKLDKHMIMQSSRLEVMSLSSVRFDVSSSVLKEISSSSSANDGAYYRVINEHSSLSINDVSASTFKYYNFFTTKSSCKQELLLPTGMFDVLSSDVINDANTSQSVDIITASSVINEISTFSTVNMISSSLLADLNKIFPFSSKDKNLFSTVVNKIQTPSTSSSVKDFSFSLTTDIINSALVVNEIMPTSNVKEKSSLHSIYVKDLTSSNINEIKTSSSKNEVPAFSLIHEHSSSPTTNTFPSSSDVKKNSQLVAIKDNPYSDAMYLERKKNSIESNNLSLHSSISKYQRVTATSKIPSSVDISEDEKSFRKSSRQNELNLDFYFTSIIGELLPSLYTIDYIFPADINEYLSTADAIAFSSAETSVVTTLNVLPKSTEVLTTGIQDVFINPTFSFILETSLKGDLYSKEKYHGAPSVFIQYESSKMQSTLVNSPGLEDETLKEIKTTEILLASASKLDTSYGGQSSSKQLILISSNELNRHKNIIRHTSAEISFTKHLEGLHKSTVILQPTSIDIYTRGVTFLTKYRSKETDKVSKSSSESIYIDRMKLKETMVVYYGSDIWRKDILFTGTIHLESSEKLTELTTHLFNLEIPNESTPPIESIEQELITTKVSHDKLVSSGENAMKMLLSATYNYFNSSHTSSTITNILDKSLVTQFQIQKNNSVLTYTIDPTPTSSFVLQETTSEFSSITSSFAEKKPTASRKSIPSTFTQFPDTVSFLNKPLNVNTIKSSGLESHLPSSFTSIGAFILNSEQIATKTTSVLSFMKYLYNKIENMPISQTRALSYKRLANEVVSATKHISSSRIQNVSTFSTIDTYISPTTKRVTNSLNTLSSYHVNTATLSEEEKYGTKQVLEKASSDAILKLISSTISVQSLKSTGVGLTSFKSLLLTEENLLSSLLGYKSESHFESPLIDARPSFDNLFPSLESSIKQSSISFTLAQITLRQHFSENKLHKSDFLSTVLTSKAEKIVFTENPLPEKFSFSFPWTYISTMLTSSSRRLITDVSHVSSTSVHPLLPSMIDPEILFTLSNSMLFSESKLSEGLQRPHVTKITQHSSTEKMKERNFWESSYMTKPNEIASQFPSFDKAKYKAEDSLILGTPTLSMMNIFENSLSNLDEESVKVSVTSNQQISSISATVSMTASYLYITDKPWTMVLSFEENLSKIPDNNNHALKTSLRQKSSKIKTDSEFSIATKDERISKSDLMDLSLLPLSFGVSETIFTENSFSDLSSKIATKSSLDNTFKAPSTSFIFLKEDLQSTYSSAQKRISSSETLDKNNEGQSSLQSIMPSSITTSSKSFQETTPLSSLRHESLVSVQLEVTSVFLSEENENSFLSTTSQDDLSISSSTSEKLSIKFSPTISSMLSATVVETSTALLPSPKTVDIDLLLTVGIIVKMSMNINSHAVIVKIKEGLKRCYIEGVLKASEENNRKKRANANVTVEIFGMKRKETKPSIVDVDFYVLVDGIVQYAADIIVIFSRLTIAETSAYMSFPVTSSVKLLTRPTSQTPTGASGSAVSIVTVSLIGAPIICALMATVILIVVYCRKGDNTRKNWSTLHDADLKVDIEKGEVVSASMSRNKNIPQFSFDNGKGFGSDWTNIKPFRPTSKEYAKNENTLKQSLPEMNSASQQLDRLRKLGFHVSEARKFEHQQSRENKERTPGVKHEIEEYNEKSYDGLSFTNNLDKASDISHVRCPGATLKSAQFNENKKSGIMRPNVHKSRPSTFQFDPNITPASNDTLTDVRKVTERLEYCSSDLNTDSEQNTISKHSTWSKDVLSNRRKKKLKRRKKVKSVCLSNISNPLIRNNVFESFLNNSPISRTRVPSIPTEGYCNKIMFEPCYTSLTLGKEPVAVNNFKEGDIIDEVFLTSSTSYQNDNGSGNKTIVQKTIQAPSETAHSLAASRCKRYQIKCTRNRNKYANNKEVVSRNNFDIIRKPLGLNCADIAKAKDNERSNVPQSNSSSFQRSLHREYTTNWPDDPIVLNTCLDNFADGSEYAGHEFESLNFDSEYPRSPSTDLYFEPISPENITQVKDNMAKVIVTDKTFPGNCEHVTKMGRVGINNQDIYRSRNAGPQFRKLPFQDQTFLMAQTSTPVATPSPRKSEQVVLRDIVYKERIPADVSSFLNVAFHTRGLFRLDKPWVEMKLGRNMRAAPKGSLASMSASDTNTQPDASVPLLQNHMLQSNHIADYFANTNAALHPHTQGSAIASRQYPSRSISSPQHPSQDLIETLNRNNLTSLTQETRLQEEQRTAAEHQERIEASLRQLQEEERQRKLEQEKENPSVKVMEKPISDTETKNTLLDDMLEETQPKTVVSLTADINSPPPPVNLYGSLRMSERFNNEQNTMEQVSTQTFSPRESYGFSRGGNNSTATSLKEGNSGSVSVKQQETVDDVEDIEEDIKIEKNSDDSDNDKINDDDLTF